METSTKNQNEQQNAKTSNQAHLPVLVFEMELIQQRAAKSRTANGNKHQKPKRATKINKKEQSIFYSFAPLLDLWKVVNIKSNENPKRATMRNNKKQEQRRATKSNAKSNEEQQSATKSNEEQRRAMKSNEEQRRATKSNEKQRRAMKSNEEQ